MRYPYRPVSRFHSPASSKQWQNAAGDFNLGADGLAHRSRQGDLSSMCGRYGHIGMIQSMARHNSHHAGQIVLLRQILGHWPVLYVNYTSLLKLVYYLNYYVVTCRYHCSGDL